MFKKDKEYLGISLNEGVLKLAHVRLIGRNHKVVNVVKKDVREMSEDQIPSAVQAALAESGAKSCDAILSVPANLVTTKNIEIPSLDKEEIKSIIDLQAGRHTPYSREEILIGWVSIGVFQRNFTKVLLVIINRDVLKKQVDLLMSAGVRIERVLFAPEGIAGFYAQALGAKEEDPPAGVIDIASQVTNFCIEYNGTVATCRCIPVGLSHLIKEGQAAQDKLLEELANSVDAYQNEDVSSMPENYLLTSDDAKVKDLQTVLQERLKANVKVNPFLDQITADQPVMLKMVSEYSDESFLDVIAPTLTSGGVQVDLTPEEVVTQRQIEEKGRQVVKAAALAIILLFLTCGIFFSKIYFKGVLLDKLKDEYVQKRRAVIVLDRTAQRTRIIKDYINSRMVGLDVLSELYRLVPKEIYLQTILLDENGTINIQGVSESMSRVFNFVTALEESELFKGVKTRSTTAKKDRGKDVAAFDISFRLESAKDETEEEKAAAEEAAAAPEEEEPPEE